MIEGSQSSGHGSRPCAFADGGERRHRPRRGNRPRSGQRRRPPAVRHRHLEHRPAESLGGEPAAGHLDLAVVDHALPVGGGDRDEPPGAERAHPWLGDRGETVAAMAASTALPPASATAAPAAAASAEGAATATRPIAPEATEGSTSATDSGSSATSWVTCSATISIRLRRPSGPSQNRRWALPATHTRRPGSRSAATSSPGSHSVTGRTSMRRRGVSVRTVTRYRISRAPESKTLISGADASLPDKTTRLRSIFRSSPGSAGNAGKRKTGVRHFGAPGSALVVLPGSLAPFGGQRARRPHQQQHRRPRCARRCGVRAAGGSTRLPGIGGPSPRRQTHGRGHLALEEEPLFAHRVPLPARPLPPMDARHEPHDGSPPSPPWTVFTMSPAEDQDRCAGSHSSSSVSTTEPGSVGHSPHQSSAAPLEWASTTVSIGAEYRPVSRGHRDMGHWAQRSPVELQPPADHEHLEGRGEAATPRTPAGGDADQLGRFDPRVTGQRLCLAARRQAGNDEAHEPADRSRGIPR